MNKEQQIEQMSKIINELYCVYTTTETDIAEGIYKAGYRKINANCAVITKDELKEYKRKALKEFAEKLKECAKSCKESGYDGINEEDIDLILKEYE